MTGAESAALSSRRPHDAGSIGQAQVGGLEHAGELGVAARPHDELGVYGGDEVGATAADELSDPVEGGFHVQAVDPHAEDPGLCHLKSWEVANTVSTTAAARTLLSTVDSLRSSES